MDFFRIKQILVTKFNFIEKSGKNVKITYLTMEIDTFNPRFS
jgi:hypothetical protein